MTFLQNLTPIRPKVGNNPYLRGMNDKKDINRLDEDDSLTPYTMEEINAMINEAEQDFEDGRFYTTEEVFQEVEEEIKKLRLESL